MWQLDDGFKYQYLLYNENIENYSRLYVYFNARLNMYHVFSPNAANTDFKKHVFDSVEWGNEQFNRYRRSGFHFLSDETVAEKKVSDFSKKSLTSTK